MRLIYPREANLTLDLGTNVRSLLNGTQPNATLPIELDDEVDSPPKKRGWFASFLEHIPGYTWLRIKLGRLVLGPTYEMPPDKREAYVTMMAEQERLEEEAAQKEADMKVQKFMAKAYPDYYFKKYVFVHPNGSEERKRALFIFVLTNKQEFGRYWTRQKDFYTLRVEFEKMGVKMTGNIVADLLRGVDMNTTVTDGGGNKTELENRGRRKRWGVEQSEGQDIELLIPDGDLELYLSAKEMVERTSIEGLRDPRSQTVEREDARSYIQRPVIWDEEVTARARYN
jgi:hypothetical protein